MYEPLGINTTNHLQVTQMGQAAKALGWERKKIAYGGGRLMCYTKGEGIDGQIELEPFRGRDGVWRIVNKMADDDPEMIPERWSN